MSTTVNGSERAFWVTKGEHIGKAARLRFKRRSLHRAFPIYGNTLDVVNVMFIVNGLVNRTKEKILDWGVQQWYGNFKTI